MVLAKRLYPKNNLMQNTGGSYKAFLLAILLCSAGIVAYAQSGKDFRIVGYLMAGRGGLANAQQINLRQITHLNLAFINPDSTGKFVTNPEIPKIIALAHRFNVKVLMSIGGGNIPAYLPGLFANDKRAVFINNIVDEALKQDYDGVDVDLEGDAVNNYYSAFVTELADALAVKHKLITAAVATWYAKNVTDSALARFDFINIMSYDKTGPWEPAKAGPHSPYEMAAADVEYWRDTRHIAGEKLNIGLPFYGYGFGPNNTTSDWNYRDIISKYPGAENKDELKAANGHMVYYNGLITIKKKTMYARQQTGGVMIWELSQDASGPLSLLKAINDVAGGR